MKYFIDTEFIEGTQSRVPFIVKLANLFSKSKPTIDLISIGIVCEDNRKYYAISKDFNLKEAWNRCEKRDRQPTGIEYVYWIRDNVLKPIFIEECEKIFGLNKLTHHRLPEFTYKNMKLLINRVGKTNKQIAEEVKHFVANRPINAGKEQWILDYDTKDVQFYGYYCDYDWVVFCWLFGRMIDLPKGFPMYCIDLKQILDEKQYLHSLVPNTVFTNVKDFIGYPKQTNEHNALADAKWNKELYEFLETIK